MDIRPIETRYKGYRFRSRLEARWAVFFDAIGLEYEYEAQGFELKSGRYLPDFYIPILKKFVEVKPRNDVKLVLPAIYFAGRMRSYRTEFTNGHQRIVVGSNGAVFSYSGPFYTKITDEYDHDYSAHDSPLSENYDHNHNVVRRDFEEIRNSKMLFALFTDTEAHGTLVEIGVAHALKKRVVIAFVGDDVSNLAKELWFSAACAEKVITSNSIEDALDQLYAYIAVNYPVQQEIAKGCELVLCDGHINHSILITYGDPYDTVVDGYGITLSRYGFARLSGLSHWRDRTEKALIQAAKAARSARFEYGETPTEASIMYGQNGSGKSQHPCR